MHHRRRFPHKIPKVKEAFVGKDPTVPSTSEDVYDDYLTLSDRIAQVSFEQENNNEMLRFSNFHFRSFPVTKGLGLSSPT